MGFLDKAKSAMDQAVASVDGALTSATTGAGSKQAEPYLRDLGVLAYLEATGRPPADIEEQRARCNQALYQIESQAPFNLAMTSLAPPPPAAATPPPPPGAAAGAASAPAADPGTGAPPPAPGTVAPPPAPGTVAPPPPPGTVAPPPPPSGE